MTNSEKKEARVAIIVPVYNDEKYLATCIESILFQTVDYWEALFIDDASYDSSAAIVETYSKQDSRIRLLKNEKNSSAWVARAKGILNISDTVEYILFADADDTLQPNMVERAYKVMSKNPVDILHFGSNVENCSHVSRTRIQNYTQYLQPPVGYLNGREIFDSFVSRDFEGHLWNKMFNAKLLQDVIKHMGQDRILPKAQDKVLYWAVCWSKPDLTYRGIADRLYNYNYGLGVEGRDSSLTLDAFRQYLCQAWTENAIAEVMAEHPNEASKYAGVIEKSRYNLVRHSVRNLMRLSLKDRAEGINMALSYWNTKLDAARLVCALAENTWEDRVTAERIIKSTLINKTDTIKNIHTIGTYYHRMDNGGIQRVIAQIIGVWHELGYNVVLFTDCDPTENDYDLPEYVKRVKIARPSSKCKNTNYVERGMSFAKLLLENEVDCMVYHSYFSDVLLYDECICKSLGIPFVIYMHNIFTKFLFTNEEKFATVACNSELADGIVCLTEPDRTWWGKFNGNVHVVINPLTFDIEKTQFAPRNNKNILFLGRMEELSKRPNDAISIAKKVIEKIPEAKMYMVGSTDNQKYMEGLQNRINRLHLENNIILCGYHKDVSQYYDDCSVFLSCSAYEGFMLTLCEAMSYGLPIVMYKLPYLATTQNNGGIVEVDQNDVDAAAESIVELFSNTDKLIDIGNKGHDFLKLLYKVDIKEQWGNIFNSLYSNNREFVPDNDKEVARMIVEDFYIGVKNRIVEDLSAVNEKQDKLIKQCRAQLDMLKLDMGILETILGESNSTVSTATKDDLSVLNKNIKKMVVALEKNNDEIAKLQKDKRVINRDLQAVLNSRSYKIGRIVTYIPRKIRDFFRRGNK